MRKITSFLLTILFVSFGLQAQQLNVQGVPHSPAKNSVRTEPAVVYPNIDLEDIEYTVGTGNNLSALVVKWDDGKGGNTNLVWGYRWSTPAEGTGEAMLRAIAQADPRFYMLLQGGTQYGSAIGGMGFDLNGNGNISLLKGGISYSLINGIYNTTGYDFDSYTSNDPLDHWRAGWINGYWSYWTTANVNTAYSYAQTGASSRSLSNGSIDGWSYISDMTTWYSNDMSGTPEYVTPPVQAVALSLTDTRAATATSAKTYTVNSLEELYSTLEGPAADGDIVQFRPGLRGTVLKKEDEFGYRITKSVTIIGNGVIIKGGKGFSFYESGKSVTFKDFVFEEYTANAIHATDCNLTVERCIFNGGSTSYDGTAIRFENGKAHTPATKVLISHCRFSNNKGTGRGTVHLRDHPQGKTTPCLEAYVTSCTFVGNEINEGSALSIVNYPKAYFTNCVFENNKTTNTEGVTIYIHRQDKVSAERVSSLGYNVIEGTITTTSESRVKASDIIAAELDPVLQLNEGEYQVIKNGPAYNHLPANTVIEGVIWPATDITGMSVGYTKATHSGACQVVYESDKKADYSKGVFIVNEDWYGHQNSTVNFITADGEWIYRAFQKENPGKELGATNQYGAIYGDKFYFVAKQAKDPGSSITGGRLTVCDAKTLKCLKQIENISVDDKGVSNADGRAFLGVNEHKAYIGSNNGIHIYDIDAMEIKGGVTGSGNESVDPYDKLYKGQIGSMVRVNENVYAVHQKDGILIIDAETDKVKQTIAGPDKWGYGSIVLSKDGNLWASVANPSGSGQAAPFIIKINPATNDTVRIDIPEDIYAPANSWYAWTPDCFCASNQQNVLYWNGGNSSWFSNKTIFKYDIDKNEFSKFIDFSNAPGEWSIYGCSFRIDPVTDHAYVSLFHGFQDPTFVTRTYDNTGSLLAEYPMISNYWFPSLPIFPDNAAPVLTALSKQTVDSQDPFTISLATLATDADNMVAAIVKSVKQVSDPKVLTAQIVNGNLNITPQGEAGQADVTISVNSNGKLAETVVAIDITKSGGVGIEDETFTIRSAYSHSGNLYIHNCEGFHFTVYNNNGVAVSAFNCDANNYTTTIDSEKGLHILKGSNGKENVTFKVILQ